MLKLFSAIFLKADKKFQNLEKKASFFNLIKRELFKESGDSRFKIDTGPIDEVIQERSKKIDQQFLKPGEIPFKLERATITAGSDTSGGDLVEDTIYPDLVENLFAKAWCGRIGCTFIENWRGNFVLPKENAEPASGFIAETADYPESSITFDQQLNLSPLKVGALQPFSLQAFMQDETRQLQNSINSQLMKEWGKKVDDDFLNADGAPATEPKGLLNYAGIQSLETAGANGGALTFPKCIEAEGLLTAENQDMPPVWLVNSKTVTHARSTLKNAVSGAQYIGTTKMFADRRFVESNVVKSDLTKGTGTGLSQAILMVPSSFVVVQWAMPVVSLDRSLGFKNDTVWVKISGYVNCGLKREKDFINFKSIKTSA